MSDWRGSIKIIEKQNPQNFTANSKPLFPSIPAQDLLAATKEGK